MIYIYIGYLCEFFVFYCFEILCILFNWVCNGEKDCLDGWDEDWFICSKLLFGFLYFLSCKNIYDLVVKSLWYSYEKFLIKMIGFFGK